MKKYLNLLPGIVLFAAVNSGGVAAQTPATLSVFTGAYSEEQATRGQVLYYQHCLACHGEMMTGVDQAPPLAGPQFSSIWNGESLWALVERIGTMPPEKPGSLSLQENVDILSYMLWYNGLPLGDKPLTAEQSELTNMLFQTPPPGF